MMKYILLLLAALLLAAAISPALADRGKRRALPHVTPMPTSCTSQFGEAALSGANINATLKRGDSLDHLINFFNRTEGEQWVVASVQYLTGQAQMQLPAEWVTFDPSAFCVMAGESKLFYITIQVPRSARRGEYFAFLMFKVSPEGGVGVAVAIKATITVK